MIRWFDSKKMSGLPELTNTQGDLVKMLTALLVNGANQKSVISVSYTGGVCTLTLNANHGFALYSVVSIKGSSQSVLERGVFRVKSSTIDSISFNCSEPLVDEVGLTVSYAPLGWDLYFPSEGRACYRSKNPEYPAYLRVDDTKMAGTTANAAKFASVEICEDMSSFDTAAWQSPFDVSNPQKNRATVAGSNGWFKWYYASAYSNNPDKVASPSGVRDYLLVGDGDKFWLIINAYIETIHKTKVQILGMPIVNIEGSSKQALCAVNGSPANYYVEQSFAQEVTTHIAPMHNILGYAVPTTIPILSKSNDNKNMLLQSPVFFRESSFYRLLSGYFLDLGLIPYLADDRSIVKSGNNLTMLVSTNFNTIDLALNLGGL